jgi:hypothetical protein
MNRIAFSLLTLAAFLPSCSSPLSSLEWMNGTWSTARPNGDERLEIWEKSTSKLYKGKGLKIVLTDTTILETLELMYADKAIWYIPTVPDQNAAKPVPFKMISTDPSKIIFENPKHDFPQRITYLYRPAAAGSSPDTDSLYVRVESLDGKGIDFRFRRK